MFTVLHIADIHARGRDLPEIKRQLIAIEDAVGERHIDLVVIAGDVFDSAGIQLDTEAVRTVMDTIGRLSLEVPIAIVLGTPSHDGKAALALQAINPERIHVAERPEQLVLGNINEGESCLWDSGIEQAVVSLCPTPTKQWFQGESIESGNTGIADAMSHIFAGFGATAAKYRNLPHILIGHWQVSGAVLPTGQMLTGQDIEISTSQMDLSGAAVHCLGHIHKAQQLGERSFYPGSIVPLNFGETDTKGYFIHRLDGNQLAGSEFIPLETTTKITIPIDLISADGAGLTREIAEQATGADVKVVVTAFADEPVDVDELRAMLGNAHSVDIQVKRQPRQNVRSSLVVKAQSLADKLQARAEITDEPLPSPAVLDKAAAMEGAASLEQFIAEHTGTDTKGAVA